VDTLEVIVTDASRTPKDVFLASHYPELKDLSKHLLTLSSDPPKNVFLAFNYPELKDLGKHFLTISSATAVFLVGFVEKIVRPSSSFACSHPSPDDLFLATLVALLMAIVTAGTGLFTNYIAGAGAAGAIILGIGTNFRTLARATYLLYVIAGTSLISAYVCLAMIGVLR
jgi:hypothetical protein